MQLKDKIQPIYHPFLRNLLNIRFPDEIIATCESCTQCLSKQSPYINTKCCSYYPQLVNFLVGGVLHGKSNNLAEGKKRIRTQLKNRHGITPYGIVAPLEFAVRKKAIESNEFWEMPRELAEAQKCPYYDGDRCTLWNFRENLCVTHFCSSIGGIEGHRFWKKVNKYLQMTENCLSRYAMFKLGWPTEKIKTDPVTTSDFNLEDEPGKLNEEKYQKLWDAWAGREEEFYIKCYEIVNSVSEDTFNRIAGINREILEVAIKSTHKKFINNVLPEYMILHPGIEMRKSTEEKTLFSLGDMTAEIPSVILPMLRGFNGKHSTVEVFHLGYNVLYNMSAAVEELRNKRMLVTFQA